MAHMFHVKRLLQSLWLPLTRPLRKGEAGDLSPQKSGERWEFAAATVGH
jgi:hypothetical protein